VPCFAGSCDWRLPNRFELETLVNLENSNPAVSPAFNTGCVPGCTVPACSCTKSNDYWSSSTFVGGPQSARYMTFFYGATGAGNKGSEKYVRAVRGGS